MMDDPGPYRVLLLIACGILLVFWFARRLAFRRLDFELTEPLRWMSPLGIDCSILITATLIVYMGSGQSDIKGLLLSACLMLILYLALYVPRLQLLGRSVNRMEEQNRLDEVHRWFRDGLMDFSEGVVSEVMVPLADVYMVSDQADLDTLQAEPGFRPFSRIPVYKGDRRNVIGVVYSKDLIREGLKANGGQGVSLQGKGLERDAYFVPEMMGQVELLRQFQLKKIQLAIVVDEYGITTGIVTLEDLLETLIGEIQDRRNDKDELIQEQGVREWQMDARLDLESFSEIVGGDFSSEAVETVGGLVFHVHGTLPKIGDKVLHQGFEFTVTSMEGYRLTKVDVREVLQ